MDNVDGMLMIDNKKYLFVTFCQTKCRGKNPTLADNKILSHQNINRTEIEQSNVYNNKREHQTR